MTVPTLGFLDRCIFNVLSGGTGTFIFTSAVQGYQSPVAAGVINGNSYGYAAQSADLTQWEYGYGVWNSVALSLTRTVIRSSAGVSTINFNAPPAVLITGLAESLFLPGLPAMPPVSPFDQIVGVIGGATDALYALNEISVVPTTGDITYFVATTGSDSNNGLTFPTAFATVDRASHVASFWDYLGNFTLNVIVDDGTYLPTAPIVLHALTNLGSRATINCNPGNPGNVYFNGVGITGGRPLFETSGGVGAQWSIDGFKGNVGSSIFRPQGGGSIQSFNDIICNDTNNTGLLYLANCQDGGAYSAIGLFVPLNVTFLTATIAGVIQAQTSASGTLADVAVTFQINTNSTNGLFFITGRSNLFMNSLVSFTGTAGLTSPGSSGLDFSEIESGLGLFSDFPDGLTIDPISSFGKFNFSNTSFTIQGLAARAPISTDMVDNGWLFWVDLAAPSGAGVYLAVKQGTNIYIVGSGAPYKVSAPVTGGTVTSSYGLKSNIINPAGTLANLTVNLPTGQYDSYVTRMSFTQAITALVVATTDLSAVVGAPTSAAIGTALQFMFDKNVGAHGTWYIN